MLAETLALALLLAAPGSPARSAVAGPDENASRARRGLLPRKVVRTRAPSRARRIVLVPPAPTWLGEPAAPGEVLAPGEQVEPVAASATAPVPGDAAAAGLAGELVAALSGAEVDLLLVRRFRRDEPPPALRADLSEPELQVLVIRRLAR